MYLTSKVDAHGSATAVLSCPGMCYDQCVGGCGSDCTAACWSYCRYVQADPA